jgi:hypothetical protein
MQPDHVWELQRWPIPLQIKVYRFVYNWG